MNKSKKAVLQPSKKEKIVRTPIVESGCGMTARKRVETDPDRTEIDFRSLIENVQDVVARYDLNLRYVCVSPSIERYMDVKSEALVGKTHREAGLPKALSGFFDRSLRQVIASRKPLDFEFTLKSRGIQRFIESRAYPEFDENGNVKSIVAITRNVTERQKIAQALAESEKRFRSLIEHSTDAISLIDSHGAVVYGNPSAQRLTGYSTEERMGRNGLELIHPDDLPVVRATLAEVIANKGMVKDAQFRSVRKDGTVWWAEGTAINLLHLPSVQAVAINYRDITHRKKAEQALKTANRHLNARLAQIEQLQSELREQALRDPLTRLFNRRYLSETMERELKLAKREKRPVSVIIMDIDRFKKINDRHGHRVGDEFLTEISKLLQNHARGSDIICRYGGEEFLIVMPGANARAARKRAEQLRVQCEMMRISHNGKDLKVTLSFGVATYPTHGTEGEEIVIKADKALYTSKRKGRNCVTIWEQRRG
jgi:diguanylate cyclase (GGDEF)-like protein/PAS domain S-box-containing protein